MRIKLTVEYDGTAYAGWQRQENAIAVQQRVEEALYALTGQKIAVKAAGRTDSGVHARGQVAHFDTEATVPPDKYVLALNCLLPPDIRIRRSEQVSEDFDARYGATGKLYEYKIYNGVYLPPMMRHDHCFIPAFLDTERMRIAAEYYAGVHDFAAFAASDKREGSTVREVYGCQVIRQGNEIFIRVNGRSFLYNMVRIMSGTLIEVGLGKLDPHRIPEIIQSKDRTQAGRTAPACGLTLVEVYY